MPAKVKEPMSKITVTIPTKQRNIIENLASQSNLSIAQVLSIHAAQIANQQSLGIINNNTVIPPAMNEPLTLQSTLDAIDDYKNGRAVTTEELDKDLESVIKKYTSEAND